MNKSILQLVKEFKDLGFDNKDAAQFALEEIEEREAEEKRQATEERRQEREAEEKRKREREAEEKRQEKEGEKKRQAREIERPREIETKQELEDVSMAVAEEICIPFEENVLGDKELLINALKSPLLTTIPKGLRPIPLDSGLAVKTVFEKCDKSEASFLVNAFCAFEMRSNDLIIGSTEAAKVSACITNITGTMWKLLANYVKLTPNFTFSYAEKGDMVNGRRPDETDYLNDFLVSKSEHERIDLDNAILELQTKLTDYNHVNYGQKIVYLPVISAAATFVEFGVIDVRTVEYSLVNRFNLREVAQRVTCFVTAINFFRLFHTMAPHIPKNPTSHFVRGTENIKFFPDKVIKNISNLDTCPDELYELLSKQIVPYAVKVMRKNNKLIVSPVGVRIDSSMGLGLDEVRSAIKCVLKCLQFIHEKGFVHRDVRWTNLIRLYKYGTDGSIESYTFLVIDFEFAAKDGEKMTIPEYIFNGIVPYEESYTKRHDMKLVGNLVEMWVYANNIKLEKDVSDFIHKVKRDEDPLDAEAALNHLWLRD